jgi:hypothetical protein
MSQAIIENARNGRREALRKVRVNAAAAKAYCDPTNVFAVDDWRSAGGKVVVLRVPRSTTSDADV